MPLNHAQVIECFHLGFLAVLRTRLDESRYVLKGGANLRYFFDSHRYSEDIDLDAASGPDWRFADQVDKTLASDTLTRVLRSSEIVVAPDDITKTKQTDTTRRWRVFLTAAGHREKVRTKIEFSSRNGETRFEVATVPDEVVRPYAMRPPSIQHYLLAPATEQKVVALAKRPETQARDVFDLELLLRRESLAEGAVAGTLRKDAAEAAVALTYSDFETQVLPFLDPHVASLYDERAWETMQHFVAGELLR